MADLTITAASVYPGSNALKEHGTAGETIAAGQVVYKKASDGKYYLADANGSSAEIRTPVGVALNGAAANQHLSIQTSGRISIGATVASGIPYFLSSNPGGIAPLADVGSGEYTSVLGVAVSTNQIDIDINASGVAVA